MQKAAVWKNPTRRLPCFVNIHHKKRDIRKHSHFFHSAHISLLHPGNGPSRKVYPGPAGFARKTLLFGQQRTCRTETATGSHNDFHSLRRAPPLHRGVFTPRNQPGTSELRLPPDVSLWQGIFVYSVRTGVFSSSVAC